jgi:hypothetical protein
MRFHKKKTILVIFLSIVMIALVGMVFIAAFSETAEDRTRDILRKAATENRPELLKDLPSDAGVDQSFNTRRADGGQTALHLATLEENINVMKELLRLGSDPNRADRMGRTPLMVAVGGDIHDAEMIAMLLQAGADPDIKDKHGWTALTDAAVFGKPEIARQLLNAGAEVDPSDATGTTPLVYTRLSLNENSHMVAEVLLAAGADPKHVNERGESYSNLAELSP